MPKPLARLVHLRFGLDGQAPMAKDVVAKALGVGQHTMRRLEHEALSLVRRDDALQPA